MHFGRISRIDPGGFLDERQQLRIVLNLREIRSDNSIQLEVKVGVTNVVDSRRGGITDNHRVAVLIAANIHRVNRRGQLEVNRHASAGKPAERQMQIRVCSDNRFPQSRRNFRHSALIFRPDLGPVL